MTSSTPKKLLKSRPRCRLAGVVADVRKRRFRKKGFMVGFKDIVAGAPKQVEPSFLERAKARWPKRPKKI